KMPFERLPARQDILQQMLELGDVPLAFSDIEDTPPVCLIGLDAEQCEEGLIRKDHLQILAEHDERHRNRFDDLLGEIPRLLDARDVEERDDDAVDAVIGIAVGGDAAKVGLAAAALDLPLYGRKLLLYGTAIIGERAVGKLRDEIGDRPANVAVEQVE